MMKQFYFVDLSLLFKLTIFLSGLCGSSSLGQGLDAVEQQLRKGLWELEDARGNFHPSLVEPLVSRANSAAALNMSAEPCHSNSETGVRAV